jgi:hypothetical protein
VPIGPKVTKVTRDSRTSEQMMEGHSVHGARRRHRDEIAESSCSAKTAQLCRSRMFEKLLLFYGGDLRIDAQRRIDLPITRIGRRRA